MDHLIGDGLSDQEFIFWRSAVTIDAFTRKCVSDTLDGLRDGLSHFSGPSRTAVIFSIVPGDPFHICDPQNLLRGHEPKIRKLFIERTNWESQHAIGRDKRRFGYMLPEENPDLTGLISWGGRSSSVFYQMWFSEHHPDMCAVGPTERWLEHAAWRFSHDIANEKELYTGISGSFLREYARHAIRDYIVDRMNVELGWDCQLRVYPILDAILAISRTREERVMPDGKLVFSERRHLTGIRFLARFPEMEQPLIDNFKHVRKLLQAAEESDRMLVSDGQHIVGISNNSLLLLPQFFLTADFKGTHGYLSVNNETVCSFSDGNFLSTTRRAKLVQVEEALLEADLDPIDGNHLFKIIAALVHHAQKTKIGCTLVVDLNAPPLSIPGQRLAQPIDLHQSHPLDLAKSLLKVDGALHIGRDLHMHGFACLLDGRAIPGEDRSRGARFNSALRFTAEQRNIIVVVVSADRPVSIIQEGIEVSAQCQWKPVTNSLMEPLTLEMWLENNK